MEREYKSPIKKILKVLEEGRDRWKEKTLESKFKIKVQKSRITFLEDSKGKLKQENKALKDAKQKLKQELLVLKAQHDNEERKKKLQEKS